MNQNYEQPESETYKVWLIRDRRFGVGTYDSLSEAEDYAATFCVPVSVQKYVNGNYVEVTAFHSGNRIR